MKRFVTILLLFLPFSAFTQTWTYTTVSGAQEDMFDFRSGCALVYQAPKDDELSAWQNLPFAWTFGDQDVNGYFISDNGYITFDANATISEADNENGDVRNAIFGYWDDLFLEGGHSIWSNEVRSKTAGVAPDRRHIIMWVSAVPKGTSWSVANISFAVVLYETGGFEIVHIAGRPGRNMTGSIGAIDATGQLKTLLPGSPNIEYPPLTADPNDDIRHIFAWSQTALDASMEALDMPAVVRVQQPVTVAGTIRNVGSVSITSFRIGYSIDGASEQVMDVDAQTLTTNQTYRFAHPVEWTPSEAGKNYSVTVRVFDVNGTRDENPDNDAKTAFVFARLGVSSPKRTLVEEFTGAWCGWCPDGMLQVERVLQTQPQAIAYAIHAGGTDRMITVEGAELATAFSPSYPMAMIDRTHFAGETGVPLSRTNDAWVRRAGEQMEAFTPLSVQVSAMHGASSNEILATVDVHLSDFAPPADYRVHCVLIHDKLKGSGSGWDQLNYYSNNGTYPNHPFFSLPNPVPDFEHRHVLRASATGAWGDATVLPQTPQADAVYQRTYSFTYTAADLEQNVRVVAFVTRHGSGLSSREVLNAGESMIGPLSVSAPETMNFAVGAPYPQPANTQINVRATLQGSAQVRMEVYDMLGRLRSATSERVTDGGSHILFAPTYTLESGTYLLRTTAGASTVSRMFIVAR